MTTFFLDIEDKIYIIKSLIYNITTKNYKTDTEKLETWEKLLFLVLLCLQTLHLLKVFSRILLQWRLWACTTRFEKSTLHWMNPIEITLNRRGDNKTHLRDDIRCKWTPFSLQAEHLITSIFWIPDGSPLQVRLRYTENLLAINFFPITVQSEEFANLFVTLKVSRRLDKKEN